MPEFTALLLATTVSLSTVLGDIPQTSEGISFVVPGQAPAHHPTMDLDVFTENHGPWCTIGPVRPAQGAWLEKSLKGVGFGKPTFLSHPMAPAPGTCVWDPETSGPDLSLFGRSKDAGAHIRNKPAGTKSDAPGGAERFLSTFEGDGFYLDDPTEDQTEQTLATLWSMVHPNGEDSASTRTAVQARYAYARVEQYHRQHFVRANRAFEETLDLARLDDSCLDLLPAIQYGVVDSLVAIACANKADDRIREIHLDILRQAKDFLPTGDQEIDSEILGHVAYVHTLLKQDGAAARVVALLGQQYPEYPKPLISASWYLSVAIRDEHKSAAIDLLDSILETTTSIHNLQVLRGELTECNNRYRCAANWRAHYVNKDSGNGDLRNRIMEEKVWREVRMQRQLDILLAKRMGLIPEEFPVE